MNTIWTYFLLGTLGLIVQTTIKIAVLKKQSRITNHVFSFRDYIRDDWPTIVGSLATVWIAILALDEYLPASPIITKYVKVFFAFVGFTGSSLIQAAFSFYGKKVMAIMDIKSNIADGKIPPITIDNIEGVKEIIKDKEKLDTPLN